MDSECPDRYVGELKKSFQWVTNEISNQITGKSWLNRRGQVYFWQAWSTRSDFFHKYEWVLLLAIIRREWVFVILVNAFGLNGEGREAVRLFRQVPHEMMDPWIYVCVLNACSHSGLRDEAKEIFNSIPIEQRTERIYTIMVNDCCSLLHVWLTDRFKCRSIHTVVPLTSTKHNDSLTSLKNSILLPFQCTVSWSPLLPLEWFYHSVVVAILSGARTYKNVSLSQKIFDRIQQFFPNAKLSRTAATVLLANTYASHADFSKVSDVRMKMNHSGVKKKPGLSWTVVDGQVAVSEQKKETR